MFTIRFRKARLLLDGAHKFKGKFVLGQNWHREELCDKVNLSLFKLDTEEDDFSGFSAQDEDEDFPGELIYIHGNLGMD